MQWFGLTAGRQLQVFLGQRGLAPVAGVGSVASVKIKLESIERDPHRCRVKLTLRMYSSLRRADLENGCGSLDSSTRSERRRGSAFGANPPSSVSASTLTWVEVRGSNLPEACTGHCSLSESLTPSLALFFERIETLSFPVSLSLGSGI